MPKPGARPLVYKSYPRHVARFTLIHFVFHNRADNLPVRTVDDKPESASHKRVFDIVKSVFKCEDAFATGFFGKSDHILDDLLFAEIINSKGTPHNAEETDTARNRSAEPQRKIRTAYRHKNRGHIENPSQRTAGKDNRHHDTRAAAYDSDYCRYIHTSSHLLRIDADLFPIGYDLFDDIFGFVFYDDFSAGQHRKRQIGIFFHAFDHVRIDPILFSV